MEFRLLRYFIVVAEELHLARAAERLGIEQSPVSRAMRDLERYQRAFDGGVDRAPQALSRPILNRSFAPARLA